jgi:hypothetical protein
VFTPGASAAAPTKASGSAKAKERAYGKHCGAKRKKRASQRARCIEAMSKLATGKSSSPQSACRGLSRKKAGGERKSAYALCVSAGAKVLKSKRAKSGRTGGDDDSESGDDSGDDDSFDDDGGDDSSYTVDDDEPASDDDSA